MKEVCCKHNRLADTVKDVVFFSVSLVSQYSFFKHASFSYVALFEHLEDVEVASTQNTVDTRLGEFPLLVLAVQFAFLEETLYQ